MDDDVVIHSNIYVCFILSLGDMRYKKYLLVCILTIFAGSTMQITSWVTDIWSRRQQQQKDEKAQQRRDKREIRDRGRKHKVH